MSLYDDMEVAAAEANEANRLRSVPLPQAPHHNDAALRVAIQRLAQDFSIEVLPKSAGKIKNFAELLPAKTRVFIPFLPGARFEDCVPLAIRLRREGMEPVPHIAARRLVSRLELTDTLDRLRHEADVSHCLVIAGDPKTASGPFANSLSVLETGLLEEAGMKTIFVGGQPEGIPGIDPADVERALIEKNAYARTSSASIRLITQFTLDIGALEIWRGRLAEIGNTLPVHVGMAGPTSLTTLLKFAALTGASASLRAMRRYGARLTQLASEAAPDALVTHLAREDGPQNAPIAGLHIYTFGGFKQSAVWISALPRGAFAPKADGTGFEIV